MKKSTIWLLTIVMSITFGALLYFQIIYLENMVKMREEQFSESVMRSLYSTAGFLERQETLHYLEQDANIIESGFYQEMEEPAYPLGNAADSMMPIAQTQTAAPALSPRGHFPSPTESVGDRYQTLQEVIRTQYLYQRGLLNEVILNIMRDSENRPVIERADSTTIKNYLRTELANNGLTVPFAFAVYNDRDIQLYATHGYNEFKAKDIYTQSLFPNTDNRYYLSICFPTKSKYIFSSVRFLIPTLAFTLILLVVFLFTIILAFRQKKLSEMKTDFINNMTHELKTPISTISLAAQMLADDSVRKSEGSLKHLSQVITDESKRLRFQVEKVLQMSVFDNSNAAALKLTTLDANTVIANVVSTFKIKVERFGGSIRCDLDAQDAYITVDEMQFTNVIFNLLDNAVKYRREEVAPELIITTRDMPGRKLEIRVHDNGIGIKKDDLKRIFEKFYRVSTGNLHDVKGFGLGLAYVRKMVLLFGGAIRVESEFGKSTTFIIDLPLAQAPREDDEENN